MRFVRALPFLAGIVAVSAGAGLLYTVLSGGGSLLAGAIYGASIGLIVSATERGLLLSRLHDHIRGWPSLVYIPVSEAACLLLVCLGYAIGGMVCWSLGIIVEDFHGAVVPSLKVIVYGFTVAALLIFVTRVRDLLGRSVFTNFLIGRYHRPVREERVFLFLDLAGSTAYAREHGDLRAQDYLGAIFAALAEPVRTHGGSIDDYVGDMALVTWPLARGVKNADCVRCVIALLDRIADEAPSWQRKFGRVPSFHIALHGGPVVTAEVGIDRHKISYFGDVVNTTSRLERLSRDLGVPFVISGELLERLPALPPFLRVRSLGTHALTGRDQRIEAFAIEQTRGATVLELARANKIRRSTAGV